MVSSSRKLQNTLMKCFRQRSARKRISNGRWTFCL